MVNLLFNNSLGFGLIMYCKNCGKIIDNGSRYCKFCGIDLSEQEKEPDSKDREYTVNLKLEGEINHSLETNNLSFLTNLIRKHTVIVCIYIIWFILNIIFLVTGENEHGFWPYITENGCSWDLGRYGLPEFLIYVILIPFVSLFFYKVFLKIANSKKPDTPNENKKNAIFLIIFLLLDVVFLYWLNASNP